MINGIRFRVACISAFLSATFQLAAQPVNDNPCGAIDLPVAQTADPCAPTVFTMVNPTYLNLSLPDPGTCPGPVALPAYPDYWFKFTATSTSARLNFSPENGTTTGGGIFGTGANYFVVYKATNCNGPFTITKSCGRSDIVSTTMLSSLDIGGVYYVRIISALSNVATSNFGICVSTNMPASSARVGIHTSLPQANLDVAGNVIFRNQVSFNEAPSFGTFQLGNKIALLGAPTGNHYGIGIQSGLLQLYSDGAFSNIVFGSGSSSSFTERARVINNGEVAFLSSGRMSVRTGSQSAGIWFANAANTNNVGFAGVPNDNVVGLFGNTGAGWGLTMNANNGYVGIGLNGATAQAPLQFSNALGLTKISLFKGTYGDVGIGVYGGELRLQNDIPNGKVTMGILETNGSFTELAKAERNGAYAFSIFGSLWANGTTYASDGRFKKNIEPLQESLDKILQLQGVSYQMKVDEFPKEHFDPDQQVGLIAQDVEKIVPEVVSTGPDGYKAIDYAKLVPLLIEGMKQQQKEIDALKKEVKSLKKK